MRKILAIIAGLIAVPAGAYAADKAGPAPGPVVAQGPGETLNLPFQGLYIGGALGAADGQIRDSDGFKIPREGLTAAVFGGYNHRLPGVIVGGEVDFGLTDISGTSTAGGFRIEGSSKYLASIRGRVGKAIGDSMLYGTAGVAMTDGKIAVDDVGSASKDRINGFVYGVGFESFIFGNMGVRLEALRYDWRPEGLTSDAIDTGKLKSHDTHVRAGLVVRLN